MTWLKGKHTLKAGGSLTLRSREILNADSITGIFDFNNNTTSNCAGHHERAARSTARPASTSPASCSGIGSARRAATLFDAGTYTEKRPEIAIYMQDDYRVSSKLTLNLGLRWDIFKPWVEVDNKQSNFDDHDRQVRRRV